MLPDAKFVCGSQECDSTEKSFPNHMRIELRGKRVATGSGHIFTQLLSNEDRIFRLLTSLHIVTPVHQKCRPSLGSTHTVRLVDPSCRCSKLCNSRK
mmetsp:Transcript_44385/g.135288  ORF Transcript_44385/g.135288 Transcript_44385/m.135288 type:complete len:97 (-) Transcript_44385:2152-2442(-)